MEPKTAGDHLRKVRLERGMSQPQVAALIGVTTDCVTYWETNRSQPQARHYPAIIRLLGYYPFQEQLRTIGGQLLQKRRMLGLTAKAMGARIGVCGYTILAWENERYRIRAAFLKRYRDLVIPEQQSLSK